MSGIDEILPYALENFPPKDYDTYQDWFDAVSNSFDEAGNRLPLADILLDEISIFENAYYALTRKSRQEEIQSYVDYEIEEAITEEKRDIIQDITRQPTTKKTQTIETLETIKRPVTLKEFINLTGMIPSTARRELGQGVKKGLFKRVSKGVYEI